MMRNFTPAVLVVWMLLAKVRSSGVFEVRLTSLSNDKGMTSRGECCYPETNERRCLEPCRTFFTICLMHYQNKIVRSYPSCTFGQFATPLLGGNNIDLREEAEDGSYSVKLPFTFSWPKSFTLIIEVWHDEYGNRSVIEEKQILRVAKTGSLLPSRVWTNDQQGNRLAELTFSFRVICQQNYYGESCDRLCRARNDQFGHYTCSENGTKLCLEGWTGTFCEQVVCHERCNLSHGFCDSPVDCRCRLGWHGEYCEECVKNPECIHGYCHEPWQCICHRGWTGINCDIDAHFCEKYRPCKNGGSCRSDWISKYTCECPRGFGGRDCESVVCSEDICLNGGSCMEKTSSVECVCRDGFRGDRCEIDHLPCDNVLCENNGTCVDENSDHHCFCPPGFIGSLCEIDVHECISAPCQNGGTCIDEPGRFWCDCPVGYTGVICEIQEHPCESLLCENGGDCGLVDGVARCSCKEGFEGNRCQKKIFPCPPSRCANGGLCVSGAEGWHCSCKHGYKGRTCRISTNICTSVTCKNVTLCNSTPPGKVCDCNNGISAGVNCQELRVSSERVIGANSHPQSVPVISGAEYFSSWLYYVQVIVVIKLWVTL